LKQTLIANLIKGKSVVHYGCVDDNTTLIDAKMKKGYYLHKVVTDSTTRCIGIDINRPLIKYLRDQYGINNIFYGNVENPSSFEMDIQDLKQYEVLLIPDLIEHLDNVGKMLEGIKDFFSPKVKLYIMTPNPFGYLNFIATLLRREIYSPHHTCLFTTESMKVLLDRHGFKIEKVYPVFVPKERGALLIFADKITSTIFNFISRGFADLYMFECSFR
jgi:hypothetical protein